MTAVNEKKEYSGTVTKKWKWSSRYLTNPRNTEETLLNIVHCSKSGNLKINLKVRAGKEETKEGIRARIT